LLHHRKKGCRYKRNAAGARHAQYGAITVGGALKCRDIPLLYSACARELAQIGYVPTCERGKAAWVRFLLRSG